MICIVSCGPAASEHAHSAAWWGVQIYAIFLSFSPKKSGLNRCQCLGDQASKHFNRFSPYKMRPASYIRVLKRLNQTRWMHSDGRNIPKAPSQSSMAHGTPAGSIPPSGPLPNPSVASPTVPPPPELPPSPAGGRISSSVASSTKTSEDDKVSDFNTDYIPKYDKYGVLRPVRPRRKIPVRLPGGYLEPPQYPPPAEWVEAHAEDQTSPHPLWKFFYVPHAACRAPSTSQDQPPTMGSLKFFNDAAGSEESFSKGGE